MFKVNSRNLRKRFEICSKVGITTPEQRQWSRSGIFIFITCSNDSIVNSEVVNAGLENHIRFTGLLLFMNSIVSRWLLMKGCLLTNVGVDVM